MADWYGSYRSNYFKVKNKKKFKDFVKEINEELIEKDIDGEKHFGIMCGTYNGFGSLPSLSVDPDTKDTDISVDVFFNKVSQHLQKDQIAIFMEVGQEKMRYLTGCAIAINAKGEILSCSIYDIYKQIAEKWSVETSLCEY